MDVIARPVSRARGRGERKRTRGFMFTFNNPTAETHGLLKELVPRFCSYIIFQREKAPTTGTLHYQGFIYFDAQKDWSFVVDNLTEKFGLRGISVRHADCSVRSNIEYCSKDESRDATPDAGPYCFGTEPAGQGKRTDLSEIVAVCRSGAGPGAVAESFGAEYIKYHRGIAALSVLYMAARDFPTQVYWFYGPTGTGKSRFAFEEAHRRLKEEFPGDANDLILSKPYYKMGTNKWWDMYCGHKLVIVDDYRPDMCTFGELLRLFDRYPHKVETKGGVTEFLARYIYITTPRSPSETWGTRSEEDLGQLTRRIVQVKHFLNPLGV